MGRFTADFEGDAVGSDPAGFTDLGGVWSVQNDSTHVIKNNGDGSIRITDPPLLHTDFTLKFKVKSISGPYNRWVVRLRYYDANNYIMVGCIFSDNYIDIYENVAGTVTRRAGTAHNYYASFDDVEITLQGSSLNVIIGTDEISYNSIHIASGTVGPTFNANSGSINEFDDIDFITADFDSAIVEAATATDASTKQLNQIATIAEAATATDADTVRADFNSAIVEATTASDTQNRFSRFIASITENTTAEDAITTNVIKKLQSSVLSDALVLGSIYTESSFQSLVATESIVSGSLSVTTTLQSNLETISIVSGSLKSTDSIQGSIAETLIVSGSLNVDTELQSTVIGSSNLTGNLGGIAADVFRGIIDSSSGLLGTLVIDVKLIGTASSLLTISGQLNINSQLQGITLASSEVTGWLGLGLWIFVAGTSTSIATIIGSLDKQPGLVCTSVGYSNGECYLTLVPDFEAATLFWRPQSDIIETLEWNTAILKSFNGTEQRIKVRHAPRQFFKMRIFLGTDKLNSWYDSIIHTWQKQKWLVPIWNEYVEHTEDINIKDTTIAVDTTFADFRSSNKAIVWKSATEYEILVVDTKTDSQLSLSYAILNQFTGSKYIIPVRTAYLTSHSKKARYRNGPSFVDLVFSIYDNINLTDYVKTNDYDNITLLAQPAFMDDTYSEESDADIIIEDFETGIFKVRSNSPFNILTQGHKFFNDTKEDCWNFRRFLHSLNGRQKTIIIPTFRSDVTQIDDIEVTDTHVVIENINLASNMGYNNLRKYIGFYFEDGTLIVRKITGISGINSVSERINFDYNLDLSSAVESGDCKICFVDKCRLASDSVELQWQYAHRNECNTNLTRTI